MNLPAQIAKHLRDAYWGDNWTTVNLKDQLADVGWEEAVRSVHSFNSLAVIVCHTTYYIGSLRRALRGEPLDSKDALSFTHPPIHAPADWDHLLAGIWAEVEEVAQLVEALPEHRLGETFVAEPYGNYYRNIQGVIEHTYYHLGQVVLIKKLLRAPAQATG